MSYALITGGSKGIGKAIAIELAKRNFDLILVARSSEELQKAADEIEEGYKINVYFLSMDLSSSESPQRLFDWCQKNNFPISILVNNAGYGLSGPFENYSIAEHNNMLQININTLVSLSQLFLPQLKTGTQSYILNVASSAGYQAVPCLSTYAASKAFVINFSRALSFELKNSNVSVTCVSPGGTSTDFANRAKVGAKALKMAEKVNMTPEAVAKIAVDALFKKKTEVITGGLNKIGAFLAWILPKKMIEGNLAKIYGG